jgi:precorrin-6Y C5,15-methyltransferase (decarboxylating)
MSAVPPTERRERSEPWLAIVGLTAAGERDLSLAARAAIEQAELVVGGRRQLSLVRSLVHGDSLEWPSPLAAGVAKVLARRGRPTCVLASGDPFFYGIGSTLAPSLVAGEFVSYPAPSSVSLAASRLGWSLQDTDVVSLHGRELESVLGYLAHGRRVLALSWDRDTPGRLAALLSSRGFGASTLHVLELLGASEERVRESRADAFALTDIADLNLVGIEVVAGDAALSLPLRGSLPDAAFEHDGQLTKRHVRALTLSALGPRRGELLWDVGAGAGSIAIEWMLAHPSCRAIAIECEAERCARIGRNALALGVPGLRVVEAEAPAGLDELPAPDAVFIGGGATRPVFERCWQALRPGGRLVINAVALETEALLLALYAEHGGELTRIAIERAAPLGTMTTFRPALAVVQWQVERR